MTTPPRKAETAGGAPRSGRSIGHETACPNFAFEGTPRVVLLASPDGRIAVVNRQLERLFGYRREELIGQPVEILVPEGVREAHRSPGFVDEFSRSLGKRIESIPRENMAALQQYAWQGNIRELRNVVERAMIVARSPRLTMVLPGADRRRRSSQSEADRRRAGAHT